MPGCLRPARRRRAPRLLAAALALSAAAASSTDLLAQTAPGPKAPSPRAAGLPKPAASPATAPSSTTVEVPDYKGNQSTEQKVENLLNYLEKDYGKKAVAPFWVTRAMGVVSLARSPRPSATASLLEIMDKDKQDVVRLLAWQAVLARAPEMDAKAFAKFAASTTAMAEKGLFRGRLRAPLLGVLACAPPTAKSKAVWQKVFTEANAWEPSDIPALDALGDCLKAWHSAALVDGLVSLMATPDHAVRAEYVLIRAGSTCATAKSLLASGVFDPQSKDRAHPSSAELWAKAQANYGAWIKADRANWKEPKSIADDPWKSLKPLFVAPPLALDAIDPTDQMWYQDLELGRADLSQLEVVFAVDATGSMGDVIDWLRRDIAKMAGAFQLIAKETVGIGITFYRDTGAGWVVKHSNLTTNLKQLEPDLTGMTADGGGDIPEAVLDGLKDAIEKNKWAKAKNSARVVVLVGDAPPHEKQVADCVALAGKALASGVRLHAAKVKTELSPNNDLSSFDEIAKAGGGTTVDAQFRNLLPFRFLDPMGKPLPFKPIARPEVQVAVAAVPPDENPGDKIVTRVLADIINPQYRDRVEPLAKTLLAYCDRPAEAEKRVPFPANTPPANAGKINTQGK